MTKPKDVLRPVDETARRLGKSLVRAARYGALATLPPAGALPLASRVLVASAEAGHPLLLVSMLSGHTPALLAHPPCSLLLGEVGEGDPLAQPRISVFGAAEVLEGEARVRARDRFLARHPTADVYSDFADFRFFQIVVAGASLNAGFARAYEMTAGDLLDDADAEVGRRLRSAVAHMNADHADAVDAIARVRTGAAGAGWRIATADRSGFEIARESDLRRIFFERPIDDPKDIRAAFVTLTTNLA